MQKQLAEFIGTFTLVLFGCGAAVLAGGDIGLAGISFAFGFALIGMAYGIGPVSGCHINPAVSLGAVAAGRMSLTTAAGYIVAQILGAVAGAFVLMTIASGKADYSLAQNGLGQNGWGPGYLGEYTMTAAFLFEVVASFLFMVVILGATGKGAPAHLAGLAIGIALVVIHLVGINVTGVSVNPARSIGPAVFVGRPSQDGVISRDPISTRRSGGTGRKIKKWRRYAGSRSPLSARWAPRIPMIGGPMAGRAPPPPFTVEARPLVYWRARSLGSMASRALASSWEARSWSCGRRTPKRPTLEDYDHEGDIMAASWEASRRWMGWRG